MLYRSAEALRHPKSVLPPHQLFQQSVLDTRGYDVGAFFLAERIIRVGGGVNQRTLAHFREHGRGKCVPRAEHTAADHEHIEVENVDEAGYENAEGHAEALENVASVFVAQ